MKKALIVIAAVVLFAASGYGVYSKFYLPAQAAPEPALQTSTARTGDITITAAGVGNILPAETVSIGFQVSGVVAEISVAVGERVEAGQVLARLEDTDARLRVRQAELDLNTLFSPESLQQAGLDRLNAKEALADAEDQLEYLISAPVYYWEEALAAAQAELARLETSSKADEAALEQAQKAVTKAELYLQGARNEYYLTYVWDVFPYSYEDETTGEWIDTYLEPTEDSVTAARLEVEAARLALQEAEEYLLALQAGRDAEPAAPVTVSGTRLANLDQARLELELAQADLEKTLLRAPFAGVVTSVSANPGQAAGTAPFLAIETLDQMALRFYVEESDLSLVQVGNPVNVIFEAYPDQAVRGEITYLEPAMQTIDGSPAGVVWASLPGDVGFQLLSGMSAEVEVIAGEALDTLLVPVQALRELAPGSYAVFVVQPDGSLKMTPVTVGLKDYANAQILSGLKAGDVVSTGTAETK